jgi:hypothetical protein
MFTNPFGVVNDHQIISSPPSTQGNRHKKTGHDELIAMP